MNRLVEEVQKLNVLEQALPFAVGAGERLGRPRLLGRVVGLNIWWFQAVPRATRELEARLAGTWAGTASELTHLVLGRGRDPKGPALQVGDYTASAMEINIQGAVETVYLLTQVVSDGQKSLSITIPNSAEETRYRLVQGLVDGFSVIDSRGVITDVVDRATFAPLVLSRCRAVSNTASSTCPSDTEQLRMQLNTQGLSLHCGGKANEGPRWLLEPAWVTLSAGLRPVRPLEPAATPGTSEYRTWVTDQRAGARRSMQEQGVSKHRLLQMLMAGGVENVNLEDVSKLMRGRS